MKFPSRNFAGFIAIPLLVLVSCGQDTSQKTSSPGTEISPTFGQAGAAAVKGYNQAGQEITCSVPSAELACTMIFTVGEQFAAKCKAEGGQEFACACHQYICSKKIIFP